MTDPDAAPLSDTGMQAAHQAALDAGRFVIQRCQTCSKSIYFPREVCPHCGSAELAWVSSTGRGTVYATTTVRRASDAGGDYNVALIDLDEGVRLMSRVDNLAPHEVRIGQVVVAKVKLDGGHGVVLFDAIEAGTAA